LQALYIYGRQVGRSHIFKGTTGENEVRRSFITNTTELADCGFSVTGM